MGEWMMDDRWMGGWVDGWMDEQKGVESVARLGGR